MYSIKFIGTAIAAALLGFGIHIFYGQGFALDYVQSAASAGRLANVVTAPPAGGWMFNVAVATTIIPMLGKVFLYLLLQEKLPGNDRVVKGLWFGLILLFVTDWFVRMPVMMVVGGNPVDVVFVQSLERWIIYPATGVLIALLAPDSLWLRRVGLNKQAL